MIGNACVSGPFVGRREVAILYRSSLFMTEMCAVPPCRVSSAPVVECRRKLKSDRSFGTGSPGKGNWNGEVIVLEELEVVEAVGDKGRL